MVEFTSSWYTLAVPSLTTPSTNSTTSSPAPMYALDEEVFTPIPVSKPKKPTPKFNIGDRVLMTEEQDGWICSEPGLIKSRSFSFGYWYYVIFFEFEVAKFDGRTNAWVKKQASREWGVHEFRLKAAVYQDGLDNWE